MNDKEMTAHIKALTKIIELQSKYLEQLMRKFTTIERTISFLSIRVERLKGEWKEP